MPKITLGPLKCINTEDNILGDHPYIKLDGKKVWGPVRMLEEFDDPVGVARRFTGKVTVELWEEDDLDADDLLGRHVLKDGSGTIEFARDGSNYKLKYKID